MDELSASWLERTADNCRKYLCLRGVLAGWLCVQCWARCCGEERDLPLSSMLLSAPDIFTCNIITLFTKHIQHTSKKQVWGKVWRHHPKYAGLACRSAGLNTCTCDSKVTSSNPKAGRINSHLSPWVGILTPDCSMDWLALFSQLYFTFDKSIC